MLNTDLSTRFLSKVAFISLGTIAFNLLGTTSSVNASVLFFNDFASFDQVTDTSLVEDFENGFSNLNVTYTALSGSFAIGNYALVSHSSILTANGDEDFKIEFSFPTNAVGFDTYLNGYGPATVQIFGSGQLIDTFIHSHDKNKIGFLGIVSDEAITAIRWTTIHGGIINTGIDNIRQGYSQSVPEPLTILGAGSAIGLGTLFKRQLAKKKKSKVRRKE